MGIKKDQGAVKRIVRFIRDGKLTIICLAFFIVSLTANALLIQSFAKDYDVLFDTLNSNGFVIYERGHPMSFTITGKVQGKNAALEKEIVEGYINLFNSAEKYSKNFMIRLVTLFVLNFTLSLFLIVCCFLYEINIERRERGFQKQLQYRDGVIHHYAHLSSAGQIAGNIIHQWKQPLNNLMMIISNIQASVNEGDHELAEELARDAKREILFFSGTISDFREMLISESEDAIFDLKETAEYALSLFKSVIDDYGIRCTIRCDGNMRVLGKKSRLIQVFNNLLDNAIYAIREKKNHEGRISIVCTEQNAGVNVVIQDNGGGIAEDIKDQIFNFYYTSKGSKGSGLGLAISREIISNYFKGSLSFENTEGGAGFIINIPRYGGTCDGKA
jgi:signal transduction histidine kinase